MRLLLATLVQALVAGATTYIYPPAPIGTTMYYPAGTSYAVSGLQYGTGNYILSCYGSANLCGSQYTYNSQIYGASPFAQGTNNRSWWGGVGGYNSGGVAGTGVSAGITLFTGNSVYGSGTVYGKWFQLQLPGAISLSSYQFIAAVSSPCSATGCTCYNHLPTNWLVAGSNDGSTWYAVDYQSSYTLSSTTACGGLSFTPADSTSTYSYFRLVVHAIGAAGYLDVGQWNLFSTVGLGQGASPPPLPPTPPPPLPPTSPSPPPSPSPSPPIPPRPSPSPPPPPPPSPSPPPPPPAPPPPPSPSPSPPPPPPAPPPPGLSTGCGNTFYSPVQITAEISLCSNIPRFESDGCDYGFVQYCLQCGDGTYLTFYNDQNFTGSCGPILQNPSAYVGNTYTFNITSTLGYDYWNGAMYLQCPLLNQNGAGTTCNTARVYVLATTVISGVNAAYFDATKRSALVNYIQAYVNNFIHVNISITGIADVQSRRRLLQATPAVNVSFATGNTTTAVAGTLQSLLNSSGFATTIASNLTSADPTLTNVSVLAAAATVVDASAPQPPRPSPSPPPLSPPPVGGWTSPQHYDRLVLDMPFTVFNKNWEKYKEMVVYAVKKTLGPAYAVTLASASPFNSTSPLNVKVDFLVSSPNSTATDPFYALFCPAGEGAPACPSFLAQLKAVGLPINAAYYDVQNVTTSYAGLPPLPSFNASDPTTWEFEDFHEVIGLDIPYSTVAPRADAALSPGQAYVEAFTVGVAALIGVDSEHVLVDAIKVSKANTSLFYFSVLVPSVDDIKTTAQLIKSYFPACGQGQSSYACPANATFVNKMVSFGLPITRASYQEQNAA